mmetsp:Transcript_37481/g.36044  ORF Transcript_37481/g.36044 Transcript_37481/m.36044 type:complete len:154 (+) Transcript_37481:629-1090(+)
MLISVNPPQNSHMRHILRSMTTLLSRPLIGAFLSRSSLLIHLLLVHWVREHSFKQVPSCMVMLVILMLVVMTVTLFCLLGMVESLRVVLTFIVSLFTELSIAFGTANFHFFQGGDHLFEGIPTRMAEELLLFHSVFCVHSKLHQRDLLVFFTL